MTLPLTTDRTTAVKGHAIFLAVLCATLLVLVLPSSGGVREGEGYQIHTITEDFDYVFPDGTSAFLRSFGRPMVDNGEACFDAITGIFGTGVIFLYRGGELINLMDTLPVLSSLPYGAGAEASCAPWIAYDRGPGSRRLIAGSSLFQAGFPGG